MSGLEVVGALASVVQLTSFAAEIVESISKIYMRLRNASRILRRYLSTLNQLKGVVLLLQSNEWLRAKAIVDQLKSIHEKINEALALLPLTGTESRSLLSRLSRGTQKAFQYVRNEDELKAIFLDLEEMKSTLVLCVLNTQVRQTGQGSRSTTELLGQLRTDFAELRTLLGPTRVGS